MNDRELIGAIRRGDTGAFETLYRRHKDAIFRYACALSGRVADGEDLLQEAFLGLLRNIDTFDAGRPVVPYLLRAVRSRHIDRLRSPAGRGLRLSEVVELDARVSAPDPAETVIEEERLSALHAALRELSPPQFDVVTRHVFGGLSYGEIAEAESLPKATVRTRYRAAIGTLRKVLGRKVTNG